ncbi:phosphatidylglycerol--membrane-oligosaccharide glycerophosphotransferase [Erwiniaceae bacterium BAC15a-03b]|uniref:Phosphatidylglycerol--membrane-oligosaccharide glycerophosphotransferase n=1 Tax=Winslowiella arboricola TaxID=2978220 RepID=A0A9J6PWJ8_9GAMM|nr:phosphatidylglycerol--membrane-oligosaccharide glycerophosphotransferase [Winslowiella arboricola]MCU5773718.1 phosphatidylglycerol--membrane-oligosaccharide glycerophosphotransferase [Winslowiella arboricola]MCU5778383.1 phosphatidylglycerol--membrane-oligosaccharide glycerophosphotransferase [Winslowiella arboricola]
MSSELLSVVLFLVAIVVYATKAGRNKFWFSVILIISGAFVVLNATLFASNYFTGDGINDAVIYTLTNSMEGAGISKYVLPAIGLILALFLIFCLLSWILLRRKEHPHHIGYSLMAVVLALASIKTTPAFQQVFELVRSQTRQGDSDFAAHYKVPHKTMTGSKPNLVYIYAESLERTYFDEQAFPGLTAELSAVKDNAIDFSQTEQLPGTEYTIAGMVASQCGIPLFAPFSGNASAALSSFYPENICLGDILKASGYDNYFMQGADLRFAGKDLFLKSHGFDSKNMYGLQELEHLVDDAKYRNNWGYYDDTVLDEVWQKFTQLSQQKKPFALFTLTVDTHHPDGFISRSCQRKSYSMEGKANQSFSAVTCSQEHIARLIERIKASPYFKNTVIVVSSDHLAMNNTAYKYLTKQDRKNLFFIVRGDQPDSALIPVKRSPLDNGATVLDILGGDNYIGLGRSSLSGMSLSSSFLNMKEKISEWKPDIVKLWNFPKTITSYVIDQKNGDFSFSGANFKLPLLLRITDGKVEPLPEGEYSAPLRYQLADFTADDKFIWVDKCFKMARMWAHDLALSNQLCLSSGQLNSQPEVMLIKEDIYKGKVNFKAVKGDDKQFTQNIARLKILDNDIRYQADSFIFNLPGAPQAVKQFSGISRPEEWGRWSNANLAAEVKIEYSEPLPESFDLVITARAIGPNIHRPIPISVGEDKQQLNLGEQDTTTTLHFRNPAKVDTLVIVPPEPLLSNEGNITGHDPRRLGIGMVDIKIVPTVQ